MRVRLEGLERAMYLCTRITVLGCLSSRRFEAVRVPHQDMDVNEG